MDFFVINGPNNLLGRLALEKMWPTQYKALRYIATEVPVMASSAKIVKRSSGSSSSKVEDSSQHVQPQRTLQTPLDKPHVQTDPGKVTPAIVPTTEPALPERRMLPPLLECEITKAMGEAR